MFEAGAHVVPLLTRGVIVILLIAEKGESFFFGVGGANGKCPYTSRYPQTIGHMNITNWTMYAIKKKISRHNIWWGSRLEMLWKGKLGDIYILLYMHIFEIPKEKIIKNKIKSIKRKNRRKEGKKWKERPYNMISLNINRFINMVGHACLILNLCSFSNVTSTRYRRNYYNNITNKS